jgi:hypothetical protein
MKEKDPGLRLLRWRIQLDEYDYEIVYKKGSLNTNADALSRIASLRKDGTKKGAVDEETKKQILL